MNLIDAIKSGRPFKRAQYDDWYKDAYEWAGSYHLHNFNNHSIIAHDVLADDWEIQESTVTITRSQFWEAWTEVLKARGVKYWGGSGIRELGTADLMQSEDGKELAKRLGLEGPT